MVLKEKALAQFQQISWFLIHIKLKYCQFWSMANIYSVIIQCMTWNASTLHLFISSLRATCTRTGPPTGQTRSAVKVVKTLDQCQQSVLHSRAENICGIMWSAQKHTKSFQSLDTLLLCKEVFRRNLLTAQCKYATLLNARDKWQAFLEG